MQNIFLATLLALCVSFLIPTSANAQTLTPAKKAEFERILNRWISYYENFTDGEKIKLIKSGELVVEESGDFFAATLPHLTLEFDKGQKVNIGFIAVNGAPTTEPNQWTMAIAWPMPLTVTNPAGETVASLNVGTQKLYGLWDEQVKGFLKYNIDQKNIRFAANENGQSPVKFTVASVTGSQNIDKDSQGTWSGPGFSNIKDVRIGVISEKNDARFVMNIGDIDQKWSVAGMDLEEISKMVSVYEDMQSDASEGKHTDASVLKSNLENLFSTNLFSMYDNAKSEVTIKNVETSFESSDAKYDFSLAKSQAALGLNGLDGDQGKFLFSFGFNGLSFAPQTELTQISVPQKMNFNLAFEKIPYQGLEALIHETSELVAFMETPQTQMTEAQKEKATTIGQKYRSIFYNAGTNLNIGFSLSNPTYSTENTTNMSVVQSGGVANAEMSGSVGEAGIWPKFAGTSTTSISGLGKFMNALNSLTDVSDQEKAMVQQAVGGLTMMQMMGQADPNDPDTIVYKLEIKEDGTVLLNGSNMANLQQMMPAN